MIFIFIPLITEQNKMKLQTSLNYLKSEISFNSGSNNFNTCKKQVMFKNVSLC